MRHVIVILCVLAGVAAAGPEAKVVKEAAAASERKYHWPLGRRPDEHPGLSELGL